MKFRFVGRQRHDRHEQMKHLFIGREPVEVTDEAAIRWFAGNPLYQEVVEPPVEEPAPVVAPKPKKAKKAK